MGHTSRASEYADRLQLTEPNHFNDLMFPSVRRPSGVSGNLTYTNRNQMELGQGVHRLPLLL